ncbi:MAG: hypothetical protein IKR17_08090 [Bacteroidales bacterium]|nr:hypothetical protein [Bacteroidales bacterium]
MGKETKRIKYSVPLRSMWDMYRKWTIQNHSKDYKAFYGEAYTFAKSNPIPQIQLAEILTLNFWRKDYQGEFLHIWLEWKDLYDFLANDVALKDLTNIKRYLIDNGIHKKTDDPYYSVSYNSVHYDIALHIPNSDNGFAFSFCLMPDNTIAIFFVDGDGTGQIHESEYLIIKNKNDEESKSVERTFRFAINILAYMECFPECVHEGIPSINNEVEYQFKGRNIKLGISDKILEDDGQKDVKRPHMRKGYFKCLSSDFYKNKKGQIIFVRETMVNSKSKTVVKSNDEMKIDKFKNES